MSNTCSLYLYSPLLTMKILKVELEYTPQAFLPLIALGNVYQQTYWILLFVWIKNKMASIFSNNVVVGQTSDKLGRHNSYSYFKKGCRKNVHTAIPKGSMGYDQYTVSDNRTCRTYFCCFPLALANTFPWPFVLILSNFFKEQWT